MINPERFVAGPGDPEIQNRIDNYFDLVLQELGYDERQQAYFCEIRSREIAFEMEGSDSNPHLTDDRITELRARTRTIATALFIRDDFNFIQVMLASFLTPGLIDELRP